MIIALIGESCTGKSTVADMLKENINAKVYAGKDYLRFAKNEKQAKDMFSAYLNENESGSENIIYVISEKDGLEMLPPKALRIVLEEDIEIIKERFAKRMNGHLPPPVEKMLMAKHGMFNGVACDMKVTPSNDGAQNVCEAIEKRIKEVSVQI